MTPTTPEEPAADAEETPEEAGHRKDDEDVDQTSEESFPASDPPSSW